MMKRFGIILFILLLSSMLLSTMFVASAQIAQITPQLAVPTAIPTQQVITEFQEIPRSGITYDIDDVEAVLGTATALPETSFPPQWASDELFALVSVPRANLRSEPNTEGEARNIAIYGERFPIIGVYYPGESTVIDPETEDFVYDDPGEVEVWYLIDTGNGAAWIFGGVVIAANPQLLDAFLNQTLTAEQQAYVDAQLAFASQTISMRYTSRLRSGPGTDYRQVGIIPFGGRVAILGRNELSTWFLVDYNGQQGWVNFSLMALPDGFNASAVAIVR